MPGRRLLPTLVAVAAGLLLAGVAPAGGQAPAIDQSSTNPCDDAALALKCPDLRMAPPSDLRIQHAGGGRVRLLTANHIVNVGQGPLELVGTKDPARPRFAQAVQVIRTRGGRPVYFPAAGWIYWKAIPGQGHYWKYYRAARFELWTLNPDGTRAQMVRTGPKLSYCFRDLARVRTWARTPKQRVFPACSQSFGRRALRLGVSPGWADVYPATYHQNWIDVTGLRGCFAFVHRADPTGQLIEQREDNNLAERIVRLPARRGSVAARGCPRPR
ncbi:MAG TPA: lysyl oxidase family protein [Baekduia sp.]|jgi:hypothetical protein